MWHSFERYQRFQLSFLSEKKKPLKVLPTILRHAWHKSCYLKFNNSKLAKAIKKWEREKDVSGEKDSGPNSKKGRSLQLNIQQCFLCDEGDEIGVLHQVFTYDADANIRAMISELNDAHLHTKIVEGDLIATEARYHHKCRTKLRNR